MQGDFCTFDRSLRSRQNCFKGIKYTGGTFHNAEQFSIGVSFTSFYGTIKIFMSFIAVRYRQKFPSRKSRFGITRLCPTRETEKTCCNLAGFVPTMDLDKTSMEVS